MYVQALALEIVFCVAVMWAPSPGHSSECGDKEQPVEGEPRKDTFCKPEITRSSIHNQLRRCVCKPGYVRNAWGVCISESKCQTCKDRPNQDFNTCQSACPLTCGEEIPFVCTLQCISRCSCPPGFVRASGKEYKCIPARECPPKCPPNSTFELCKSGCAPSCGRPRPAKTCVPYCSSGECVCEDGFAMTWRKECVPRNECPKKFI